MVRCDPAEEQLTHLNNCSSYYGNNKEEIKLEALNKLWKQHAAYVKELCQRKENPTEQSDNSSTKFQIGQPVMV